MTYHYHGQDLSTITAEEISEGWRMHGAMSPMAYGVLNSADWAAHNIWSFLESKRRGIFDDVDGWIAEADDDISEEKLKRLEELAHETVEILEESGDLEEREAR